MLIQKLEMRARIQEDLYQACYLTTGQMNFRLIYER